ncbi:MAG: hypothetical protein KAJ49_06130 [Arcobacteraceae bacterium]|nr:hypothetical protein [Arcobacteraceae bacterium]
MFTIGSINFIVDPGEIYLKKILADIKSTEFSNKLLNSKNGVVQTGWNERLIKITLAKESGNYDCIILGSSHIMQVSSIRNTGNIKNQCKKLLNLGVSGGSIEDISIFSYLILNNIKLPKKVFIDIDPWTLKFGMDSRYGANKNIYTKMNILLKESDNGNNISYTHKLTKNLFNGEYLQYSLIELFKKEEKKNTKSNIFKKDIIFPTNEFSYHLGYKEAVTLPDGSHIYKKSWILKQKNNNHNIKIGGGSYKISGQIYDKKTFAYLKKIIDLYRKNNIDVNLILTPYHPNVFKKGNTKPVQHFTIVESVIKEFGNNNNLKVYGSFFPDNLGCKGKEFYDYMHGTNECLNRIDFSK